jgi:uroporphyrinogen-III synthase
LQPEPERRPPERPPPENPLTVLVTRPEPGASATASALSGLGHVPVLAPCLTIERLVPKLPPPEQCSTLLVASSQALTGLPASFHHHFFLTVGDATARRAREAGFTNVASAGGTAEDLAALVTQRCDPAAGFLLLACGAGHSIILAKTLRDAGFMVRRRVVYRSRPVPRLAASARRVLEGGRANRVMFFSPETARRFIALVRREKLEHKLRPVIAIAISAAAATALRVLPFAEIRTAMAPSQPHMLAMLP